MNVLVEIKQSVRVEQISNSKRIGSFAALLNWYSFYIFLDGNFNWKILYNSVNYEDRWRKREKKCEKLKKIIIS